MHTGPGDRVGVKKFYVFCVGVHPTGTETRWVMEEYRICDSVFNSTTAAANHKTRGKHKLVSKSFYIFNYLNPYAPWYLIKHRFVILFLYYTEMQHMGFM